MWDILGLFWDIGSLMFFQKDPLRQKEGVTRGIYYALWL